MNALENVGYWRLFLALSRSGSLSAAARSEGCSLAAASRTLARLERELGFLGHPEGIREGTVLSAITTGLFAKLWQKFPPLRRLRESNG